MSVETRECGKGMERQGCITRRLGGGATATICSCKEDRCNVGVGRVKEFEVGGLADFMWAMVGVTV